MHSIGESSQKRRHFQGPWKRHRGMRGNGFGKTISKNGVLGLSSQTQEFSKLSKMRQETLDAIAIDLITQVLEENVAAEDLLKKAVFLLLSITRKKVAASHIFGTVAAEAQGQTHQRSTRAIIPPCPRCFGSTAPRPFSLSQVVGPLHCGPPCTSSVHRALALILDGPHLASSSVLTWLFASVDHCLSR